MRRSSLDDDVGAERPKDLLVHPEIKRALENAYAKPERLFPRLVRIAIVELVELVYDGSLNLLPNFSLHNFP